MPFHKYTRNPPTADKSVANYAAFQLAVMSVEKGDKAGAIAYYKKFIELAPAEHSRLAEAKAKLAELEQVTIEGGTSK
jgi:hypothetical protein